MGQGHGSWQCRYCGGCPDLGTRCVCGAGADPVATKDRGAAKPVIVNGKRWTWGSDGILYGPDGERAVLSNGTLVCLRENGWTSVNLPMPVAVAKALIEREEGTNR